MAPTTASAPKANNTDSIRILNRPSPAISRHAASVQKYNGGCTSVSRSARAMASGPAWVVNAARTSPARKTVDGQTGRGVGEVTKTL